MTVRVKGTTIPNAGRALIGDDLAPNSVIIANSEVITVGDFVMTDADGFIVRGTATNALAGSVVAVVNSEGIHVEPDAGTTDTYTVAADNETVAKKRVIIDESPFTVYSVTADATPGTTTGSDLRNYYADLADETSVDESTASATTGQVRLLGVDPDNSSNVLCTINEPEALRSA